MQLSQENFMIHFMRKFYGILVELLKKEVSHTVCLWGFLVSHTVCLWGFLVPEQLCFLLCFCSISDEPFCPEILPDSFDLKGM